MNEKEVTFNVKYEIVLYTPVFNARWGGGSKAIWNFSEKTSVLVGSSVPKGDDAGHK